MKTKLLILAMSLFVVNSAYAQPKSQNGKKQSIAGQSYIVTKGSGVYKLALLEVAFYREDEFEREMRAYAATKKEDYKDLYAELMESETQLVDSRRSLISVENGITVGLNRENDRSVAYDIYRASTLKFKQKALSYKQVAYAEPVFDKLIPTKSTKTDADGKFQVELPTGNYVIYSKGSRAVGRLEENYRWLLKLELKQSPNQLNLTNDNLTDSNCSQCIDTKQYFK